MSTLLFMVPRKYRRKVRVLVLVSAVLAGLGYLSGITPRSGPASTPPAQATVTRVIDGDTLVVAMPDGATERVRIVGINSPEVVTNSHPCQDKDPGSCAATAALEALTPPGAAVTLQRDHSDRDRYGRLLRWVGTDSVSDVAEPLLCAGHVQPADYRPDTSRSAHYHALATGEGC